MEFKPVLVLERNLTKRKLINRGAKALKEADRSHALQVFNDYSELSGPCKKGGREDVRELIAMFFTIETLVVKPSKKKKKKGKKC